MDENMEPPRRRGMLYENTYVWLIFVSCMDIMMTWVVLWHGGREVNVLARVILSHFGLPGMVIFKLGIVLGVVGMCEMIGRRNLETGRKVAKGAVLLSAVPVAGAVMLLVAQ